MMDSRVLQKVDGAIISQFNNGSRSLWRINCLVYAGAVIVKKRVKKMLSEGPGVNLQQKSAD